MEPVDLQVKVWVDDRKLDLTREGDPPGEKGKAVRGQIDSKGMRGIGLTDRVRQWAKPIFRAIAVKDLPCQAVFGIAASVTRRRNAL